MFIYVNVGSFLSTTYALLTTDILDYLQLGPENITHYLHRKGQPVRTSGEDIRWLPSISPTLNSPPLGQIAGFTNLRLNQQSLVLRDLENSSGCKSRSGRDITGVREPEWAHARPWEFPAGGAQNKRSTPKGHLRTTQGEILLRCSVTFSGF